MSVARREVEERYSFLSSKQVKDAAGNRPSHPDYDARTVHVPSERLGQMSGALPASIVLLRPCLLLARQ